MPEEKLQTLSLQVINGSELESGRAARCLFTQQGNVGHGPECHWSVQPLETGMQMMRVADSRWPESLQQQQASTQWNEALKTRAQSSPQLRGWLQTRQDLHAFADLVMQREKEGLTLSYIKNVIWQAERGLGQETPVESLLTQYHDARAQKQNTDALEKQINERLEGVLSRWLLLKNNVMPEAATGTTAEK